MASAVPKSLLTKPLYKALIRAARRLDHLSPSPQAELVGLASHLLDNGGASSLQADGKILVNAVRTAFRSPPGARSIDAAFIALPAVSIG